MIMVRFLSCLFVLLPLSCTWLRPASAGADAVTPVLQGYLKELAGDSEGSRIAFLKAIEADPASAELRSLGARSLASGRRFGEALALVEEGLAARPEHGGLLLLRARLLDVTGRKTEALETARKAAVATTEAYAYLFDLLAREGSYPEAAAIAAQWAAKAPENPDAHFALGHALMQFGEKVHARSAFDRVLELAPTHRGGLRAIAGLETEAGRDEAAATVYRRLVERNPHDVDSLFQLGQTLIKLGRAGEATALFRGAEHWNLVDPEVSARFGMLLLQAERLPEAESVLQRLSESHPGEPSFAYLLGVSRQAQQKHEGALEAFERVPETASHYREALLRKAFALDALERKPEALVLLRGWLRAHPQDEEFALGLAELAQYEADQRAAIEVLEALLSGSGTARAQVYFALGTLHDKLKDWRRGAEYIRRSLELRPDDPHALNYLGYTYAEHGVHLDEAEKLVQQAMELKPGQGFITDSLGWVYYKQGRYAEAAVQLRRAVELSPKDAVIWDHLGDALQAAGRRDEALAAYREAAELDPSYAPAREKLGELSP
jgi:tetratricopeptide (TPR) repeat protein